MKVVPAQDQISAGERESFYRVLYGRRDVREEFLSDPVPDETLINILHAAHHAPSVGFSQPWNFIVIRSSAIKQQVHAAFSEANLEAAKMFQGERQEKYRKLKLQGILDTPVNICVTCDRQRNGPVVLGRTHQPDTDIYSTVCAVQNLWLAARAENIGVGWVSIIDLNTLSDILQLPQQVVPVAYLCVGKVSQYKPKPDLETKGWEKRMMLETIVYRDKWQNPEHDVNDHG